MSAGTLRLQYEALAESAINSGVTFNTPEGSFNEKFCELCRLLIIEFGGTFEPITASFNTRKASYLRQLAAILGDASELNGSAKERQIQAVKSMLDSAGVDYDIPRASQDWRLLVLLKVLEFGAPYLDNAIQYLKGGVESGTTNVVNDRLNLVDDALYIGNACLQFDGVGDAVYTSSQLSPTSGRVSGWFWVSSSQTNSLPFLWSAGENVLESTTNGIGLYINNLESKYVLRVRNNSGAFKIVSVTSMKRDSWAYMECNWSLSELSLSVNGVSSTLPITSNDLPVSLTAGIRFGRSISGTVRPYVGKMSGLQCEDCMMPLAENSGETCYDASGNGNHGTITTTSGLTTMRTTDDDAPPWNELYGFTELDLVVI